MTFSRIDHVALEVADLDHSTDFYKRRFGFRAYAHDTTPAGIEIAYLRLGDTVLELVGRKGEGMGGFHFCLVTVDFEGAVAALEGLPCVTKPHPTAAREPKEEGWHRVVFAGPDGEHIEIRG